MVIDRRVQIRELNIKWEICGYGHPLDFKIDKIIAKVIEEFNIINKDKLSSLEITVK